MVLKMKVVYMSPYKYENKKLRNTTKRLSFHSLGLMI